MKNPKRRVYMLWHVADEDFVSDGFGIPYVYTSRAGARRLARIREPLSHKRRALMRIIAYNIEKAQP